MSECRHKPEEIRLKIINRYYAKKGHEWAETTTLENDVNKFLVGKDVEKYEVVGRDVWIWYRIIPS